MDEKISLEAIERYGNKYAEKVVNAFFMKNNRINGREILSLSNVQQVNLFVIKELLKEWREEQRKIRSPYFDYDNPLVKETFDQLMNLLSQNISIDREHFQPLVNKAVSQSLMLIFNPYDYFSMVVTGRNNLLEVTSFREEIKYLKVNKAPLERMLQKLEERGLSEISGNEAFGILDQILEEVGFHPEDVEFYVERFSIVHPLDPNSFFVKKARPKEPVEQTPLSTNTKAEAKPVEVVNEDALHAEQPVEKIVTPAEQTAPREVPTLNTMHTRETRPTIAENFQRINKIKESLTINQKFMFTKVLFHGDFELFSKAVDRLDQFDSLQAAMRYIEDEHASTWDRESEEFHEFMELVEKRFV
jgi:hypothetical protein